jgi:ubiquitin C-terminal hydrolase
MINNYVQAKQTQSQKQEEQQIEYLEKYDAPRNMQNASYDTYVNERAELFQEWKRDKTKSTLYKMLNMHFEKKDIPDIYTYTVIPVKRPNAFKLPAEKPFIEPIKKTTTKDEVDKPAKKTTTKDEVDKPAKKTTKTNKIGIQRCGITNAGASCYINSILQMLLHMEEFNKIISSMNDGNSVVKAYQDIYNAKLNNNIPLHLIDNLLKLMNQNVSDEFKFETTTQNDATEFMSKILETMNNKKLNELFEISTESNIIFHKTIKKGKNEIRCDDTKDTQKELHLEALIEISNNNKLCKIKDELTKKFKGISEKITDKNDYLHCTNPYDVSNNKALESPEKFPYTKTDQIIKPYPSILKVNIILFNNALEKRFFNMEIPNTFIYDTHKYRLRGIVVHIGNSIRSGHYKYFAMEDNDTIWYEYNDGVVDAYKDTEDYKLTNRPNGINIFNMKGDSPCPYLLYYQKIE